MSVKKALRSAVVIAMQEHGGRLFPMRSKPGVWVAYSMHEQTEWQDAHDLALQDYNALPLEPNYLTMYGSRWQAAQAYCERNGLGWRVMEIMGAIHAEADGKEGSAEAPAEGAAAGK